MKPSDLLSKAIQTVKNVCGIYMIYNKESEKAYVGHSVNIRCRWSNHRRLLASNKHENIHLQRSYNLYGKGSFIWIVLELVEKNKDLLKQKEETWLLSIDPEYRYNLSPVIKGSVCSEEIRIKLSKNRKGAKLPDELKKQISSKIKELWQDPEYKEHMSEAHKGTRPYSFLTLEQVKEIKLELKMGFTLVKLAKKYGVDKTTISKIRSGKNWKDVEI